MEEFFGQLWLVPTSTPKSRVSRKESDSEFWIWTDLWEAKSFESGDCFRFVEGDTRPEVVRRVDLVRDCAERG